MNPLPFHQANPWLLFPFVVSAVLLAGLGTDRLGRIVRRRTFARHQGETDLEMGTVRGALIGLLSLMIGFTFALTLNNYQNRRHAVVDLAAAVATVRDRISFLPPAQAAPAGALLDGFVAAEVEMGVSRKARFDAAVARATLFRAALLKAAAGDAASPATSAAGRSSGSAAEAFEDSVVVLGQQMENRFAAETIQAPPAVFLTLYLLTAIAWCFISYESALQGQDNRVVNALMAMIFAAVVALIADVDRPHTGLVKVEQGPLLALMAPKAP